MVERNFVRARRRYHRACSVASGPALDVWVDGKALVEPSDDEAIPAEPLESPRTVPPQFGVFLGSLDLRRTAQVEPDETRASGPKRPLPGKDMVPN